MKRAVKAKKKPARAKTRHYSVKASDWRAAFSMPTDLDEIGLRQWCVEQAIKWPVTNTGGVGLPQYQMPANYTEADVITRSTKIYRWVTGKDA